MSKFERNHTKAAKLTGEQVQQIRQRYDDGESQSALCRSYGVSIGQIGRIVRRESWQGIGGPHRRIGDMSPEEVEQQAKEDLKKWIAKGLVKNTDGSVCIPPPVIEDPYDPILRRMNEAAEELVKPEKDLDTFIKGEEK